MRQGVQGVRGKGIWGWEMQRLFSLALRLTPYPLRASTGFTILEIILVLFLLVGLLGIILPRISLEENLGSVGRQMVGTVRSLQGLAMSPHTTLHFYTHIARRH